MNFRNIINARGKNVPNQFVITIGNKEYFKSYDSMIVKIENGKVYLDETYWDYSGTTSKYRNQFLGDTTKETQRKIKSGEYILTNLNGEEDNEIIKTFKFLK
jgi:hypothetical protein